MAPRHRGRIRRPAARQTHGARRASAIVVGPSGETSPNGADELYCNARGDVRLRFHWQRDEEPQPDNRSTRWTRVAQRQAGPGMGWQWPPRIGQEVLVRFAATVAV